MNRFQRRQAARIVARKYLPHQKKLVGKHPVFEREILEYSDGETVHKLMYECAALEPIVPGYPRNSQTKVVMNALELHGAENARL